MNNPPSDYRQLLWKILSGRALVDRGPRGPILGESARVDGLQKRNLVEDDRDLVRGEARDKLALIVAGQDRAHYDGLGTLAALPLEVRCKIYGLVFPFWQCYHTKGDGLRLLGISHSNSLPAIFALSKAIRSEVLDCFYRERATKIIIGTKVVTANFLLNAGLQPGQSVVATHAKVPPSRELFIGIQVESPRTAPYAARVRRNVERVVKLLSSMNHPLPLIRVSFHTNLDTRGRQWMYYHEDFEFYMGPLRELRLPMYDHKLKPRQLLTIDRLGLSHDNRDETCDKIERAVSQAQEERVDDTTHCDCEENPGCNVH